jgi:hypothetical protein
MIQPCTRTGDELHDALGELEFLEGEFIDLGVGSLDFGGEVGVFFFSWDWGWEGGGAPVDAVWGLGLLLLLGLEGLDVAEGVPDVFRAFFLDFLVEIFVVWGYLMWMNDGVV